MARSAVWLLLGAVVAGVAWFVVWGDGDDGAGFVYDEMLEDEPEAAGAGPALEASGKRRETASAGPGAYTIRGRVIDGDGEPVADVPVEVRKIGPAHDPMDPRTWYMPPEERIRRAVASIGDPYAMLGTVVAHVRSDAQGSFTLSPAEPARYRLIAQPAPPAFGTVAYATVRAGKLEDDVVLRAMPGSPLKGRVLDTADRPVACTITGAWWKQEGGESRTWRGAPVTTSAQDGSFLLPAVPAGSVRLTVRLPNGPSLSGFSVDTPREEEYVLRIGAAGGSIEGTVTDAAGAGVAGATLLVSVQRAKDDAQESSTASVHARTGADGRYRIAGVPLGSVTLVQAHADGFLGYSESTGPDVAWQDAKVTKEKPLTLDLTLERGGSVFGKVTEEDGATGIPEVTVSLYPARTGGAVHPPRTATTDEDGSYRFEQVAQGRHVAVSRKDGYFLAELSPAIKPVGYSPNQSTSPPALTVVVTAEGKAVERNLVLQRGLPVRGRVVDPAGAGVADAEIHAKDFGLVQRAWNWGIQPMGTPPLTRSGADGAFEIPGLPPHDAWVLFARKEGYAGTFAESFELAAGGSVPELTLKLAKGATLRGTVVGLDEGSLATAQVGCWGQGNELRSSSAYKKVNPDGSFEITDLPPGEWTLNIWMNGRQGSQMAVSGLKAGEVREGVVLEMKEGVEVSGVLVTRDGEPVANTSIVLQGLAGSGGWINTQTDGEGRFSFQGVTEGRAQIMVWSAGTSNRLGEPFTAPKTGLRIVYEPDPVVQIHGRVLDPSNEPIPLATAQIHAARDGGASSGMGRQTHAVDVINGVFKKSLSGKPPFTVIVSAARDEEGKPLNYQEARALVMDPAEEVVLHLEAGLAVSGVVLDEKGAGVANVPVRAGDNRARTDKAGEFRIDGLKKEKTYIQVGPVSGYVTPQHQHVEAGATGLRFELRPALEIKGIVQDADGNPVGRGYVSATWKIAGSEDPRSAHGQIQANGSFTIDGIAPGALATLTAQVWSSTGSIAMAPTQVADVPAGKEDVVIRMGAGLTIEGVVLDCEGKPASGVYVGASTADGSNQQTGWMQTTENGSFKLAGLKPVKYSVKVMLTGGGAIPAAVEVQAPASGLRISLPRSASLAGKVVGLTAEETRGWNVRVYDAEGTRLAAARLATDGTWNIAAMKDGAQVFVGVGKTGDDRYGLAGPLDPGRDDVVLRLKTGRSISGTVDRSAAGDEKVNVFAMRKGWQQYGTVEADGRFEIVGLPPGRYAVTAQSYPSRAAAGTKDVEVGATDLKLRLVPPE